MVAEDHLHRAKFHAALDVVESHHAHVGGQRHAGGRSHLRHAVKARSGVLEVFKQP
ncbi:hypothetical protein D9M72_630750 [compost metagenome]